MRKFFLQPKQLEKWLHQNHAKYTGDCVEGVLLDSFVVSTPRGYAAVYAHYVSPWCSDYYVEFEAGNGAQVYRNWYEFEANAAKKRQLREKTI